MGQSISHYLPLAFIALHLSSCVISSRPDITPGRSIASIDHSDGDAIHCSPAHGKFLEGNDVRTLNNGSEIFPAMLDAVESAQSSINFCTYVYWAGEVAEKMAAALSDRARAGVRTRVLLDWAGTTKMDGKLIADMRASGVVIHKYNPLGISSLVDLNYRTHRKILIVDDKVAFIGGAGIAEEWEGDARNPDEWRDMHYEVRGPVVAQLYTGFAGNWNETVKRAAAIPMTIPLPQRAGNHRAQAFCSSPSKGRHDVYLMLLNAIAAAEETVRIVTPYFVPESHSLKIMIAAAQRGVDITVIVPGPHMDRFYIRDTSRRVWGSLLEAGVEIYEYQPTMLHTKLMIVDDNWVSLGSANFDPRSFRINDEANLTVTDKAFAAEQIRYFENDLADSKKIMLEPWKGRSKLLKLRELWSNLGKSQY